MRTLLRSPLVILLGVLALVSCARDQAAPDPTVSGASQAIVGRTVDNWRYDCTIKNQNTRSEYTDCRLTVLGKTVNPKLAPLVTPVGTFAWVQRSWPLDKPEYWQPQPTSPISEAGQALSDQELTAGRYNCNSGSKRPGTPADWCYSHSAKAWLSPAAALGLDASSSKTK